MRRQPIGRSADSASVGGLAAGKAPPPWSGQARPRKPPKATVADCRSCSDRDAGGRVMVGLGDPVGRQAAARLRRRSRRSAWRVSRARRSVARPAFVQRAWGAPAFRIEPRRQMTSALNSPRAGSRWPDAARGSPAPAQPRPLVACPPAALTLPHPLPPRTRPSPPPSASPPIPTRVPGPAPEPSAPRPHAARPDSASPSAAPP